MKTPKQNRVDNPGYRKWVREEGRCLITGSLNPDPHHMMTGRLSMSKKSGDDHIIPLEHSLHDAIGTKDFPTEGHLLKHFAPPRLIAEAFIALAEKNYRKWSER